MPRYCARKTVRALKISAVSAPRQDGSKFLSFERAGYADLQVGCAYVRDHDPQAGGYYVIHDDGSQHFCSASDFETKYFEVAAEIAQSVEQGA